MDALMPLYIILAGFGLFLVVSLLQSVRIVPSRTALVVERLGKYHSILDAGFHVLIPFLDKVRYSHSLKEIAVDVPDQSCFTEDNVKVRIGGVLYLMVMDPKKASYGISDYKFGTIQLAQTTMRSVIGKLELDRTFEERDSINATILKTLDDATENWGVKVTRYEIQNIQVPPSILKTMELQVNAERDKRATVAKSIGEMNSRINYSIGIMEEAINKSEGEKQKQINEAEGKSAEILSISKATAASIEKIAEAMSIPGGQDAVNLQLIEKLLGEMRKLGMKNTKVVLPLDLSDPESVLRIVSQKPQKT